MLRYNWWGCNCNFSSFSYDSRMRSPRRSDCFCVWNIDCSFLMISSWSKGHSFGPLFCFYIPWFCLSYRVGLNINDWSLLNESRMSNYLSCFAGLIFSIYNSGHSLSWDILDWFDYSCWCDNFILSDCLNFRLRSPSWSNSCMICVCLNSRRNCEFGTNLLSIR